MSALRLRSGAGVQYTLPNREAFARAVRSCQITQDWMIYHARTETWLPITVHPEFERLTSSKGSYRSSNTDLVLIYPDGEVRRTPANPEPPRPVRDVIDSGPLFGLSEIEKAVGSELQTPPEPSSKPATDELKSNEPETAAAAPKPAEPRVPQAQEHQDPLTHSWTPSGGRATQVAAAPILAAPTPAAPTPTTSQPIRTRREIAVARASGAGHEHPAVEPLPSLADPTAPRQQLVARYRAFRDWVADKMEDIETLRVWFLISAVLLTLTFTGTVTFWLRNRQLASELRELRAKASQTVPR